VKLGCAPSPRRHRDVMAVVHTHSPGVIPFAVSQVPLRAMFHNAAFLWYLWTLRIAPSLAK
jgi:hypothetical protein